MAYAKLPIIADVTKLIDHQMIKRVIVGEPKNRAVFFDARRMTSATISQVTKPQIRDASNAFNHDALTTPIATPTTALMTE